ncbi:MAG TPA: hypothetical protein VK141_00210 [Nitrosomonas sp.]|nr:hypothetical protein [Nitrosomonas sp.]
MEEIIKKKIKDNTLRTVIVLSGHTAALGIVRSLGMLGVPVVLIHYGDHDFAGRSRFVSVNLRAPHPEISEEEFINFLLDCSIRFPGAVLFPATDESLVAVARHEELLKQHFLIAGNNWNVTRSFIEKQITYSLAEKCGVPVPRTLIPRSVEEARSCGNEIGFPCLVKPCQGHLYTEHFGNKMVRVDTIAQLEEAYINSRQFSLDVMLQEFIPGDDNCVVNYNSYAREGEVLVEFTAVHIRNGPPLTGSPRVVISRKVPEVIEPGRRMVRGLGFNGFSCIEFKLDTRDSLYKVLDVNGRHNLSTLLAVRCGINFPWLHYNHISEGITPHATAFQEEIYWIDLFRDIGYTWKYLMTEPVSFMDYIRPYLRPHIFAIFDRNDIWPFLRRLVSYKGRRKCCSLNKPV